MADMRTMAIVCVGIALLIVMAIWVIHRKIRPYGDHLFDMEGEEFEEFCAELLEKQGFTDVELTEKSHDKGVDIFADKDGVSYAIQCKCYSSPVGIKAIQEVYAGKDYYCCMVGVVMTNQVFTKPAIEFADRLNVIMWDGDYVRDLIRKYGSSRKYQIITDTQYVSSEKEFKQAEKGSAPAKEGGS